MDKKTSRIIGSIALSRAFGYSPKISLEIIKTLGGADALLSLSSKDLDTLFGPFSKLEGKLSLASIEEAADIYTSLSKPSYQFLCYEDEDYPELLRECDDAPSILYIRSDTAIKDLFATLNSEKRRPVISIVGTRDISPYGKEWCSRIVKSLHSSGKNPLIVSGLAIGVDGNAHSSALACGLQTIGVSPVGIDTIYPQRHSILASKMASTRGSAIISDFEPGVSALGYNFLRRNRIIAGLADATILIESKVKGGGMMTARLAAGYGRTVLALPGRTDDIRSGGCNQLLWEKIAEPVVNLDCMIENLGLGHPRYRKRKNAVAVASEHYAERGDKELLLNVLAQIIAQVGISYEELMNNLSLSYSSVSRIAGILERDGFISTDILNRCSAVI